MFSNSKSRKNCFSTSTVCGSYSTHRCLELGIWQFLWRQQMKTTDKNHYFTPCACTRDNNSSLMLYMAFLSTISVLLNCRSYEHSEQWLHYTLLHMRTLISYPLFVLRPALFAWLEVQIIKGSDNRGSDNRGWTVLVCAL